MKEVLDTRFFIEYFYSEDVGVQESTRRKLTSLIKREEGLVPATVLAEIINLTCQRRGGEEARARHLSILRSGLTIEAMTPEIAEKAGLLKCRYRKVPMGDCIIAATAEVKGARVVSDDGHFDEIKGIKRTW